MNNSRQSPQASRWLFVLLITLMLAFLVGVVVFYNYQKGILYGEVEKDLTAIAQLKIDQLNSWYEDQMQDAELLVPSLCPDMSAFILDPSEETREALSSRLKIIAALHDYDDLVLVSTDGSELLSLSGSEVEYNQHLSFLNAALSQRTPIFLDLHQDDAHGPPHISFLVGMVCDSAGSDPLGALIMITNADQFLFPLIQSWPIPSNSAETLLVRQEGDEVVFLNDLRHQSGAALTLRIPISDQRIPAVRAVLGYEGYFEGLDYRGVPVASVVKPIPNTPWYLVAKIDSEEAFEAWHFRSGLIILFTFGMIILAGAVILLFQQRERKAYYRALFQSEAALRARMERHQTTLEAIGDGVIVTNAEGQIDLLNPAAEMMTGWDEAEAKGKQIDEVLVLIDSQTGMPAENPVEKVLETGSVVRITNAVQLVAKGATKIQVAYSRAPIRNEDGEISGVVIAFSDVTESYQMRKELELSEKKYRELVESTEAISWEYEFVTDQWTYVSPQVKAILGWEPEEWTNLAFWADNIHPADRESTVSQCSLATEKIQNHQLIYRFRSKDGGYVWLRDVIVVESENGIPIKLRGIMIDISSRMETERELRQLKDKLEQEVAERTAELKEKVEMLNRSEQALLFMVEDLNQVTEELKAERQKLEQSNRELEAFSYSVSHDLRSPLRAIDGFSKFLLEDYAPKLDDEGQRFIRVIRKNTEKMDQLISDLLNLSRISRTEMNLTRVDMKKVAHSIYHELATEEEKKSFQVDIGEMPTALCDLALIKVVWKNLIENALKYSADAEDKRIVISGEANAQELIYSIRDYGAGFDDKYAHKLFKVFQRLHRDEEFEGSGIGLVLIKRIIHRHGGKVWAQGKVGEGAKFSFSLPNN